MPKVDTVGAAAVEQARAAAEDVAHPSSVGEHLGITAEGERVVAHRFACTSRAYRGWEWTVVLARVPRARTTTVSEVVLLPGPEALRAPDWVPWSERVAPGDLGDTDVLPYRADDALLDEGYEQTPGSSVAVGPEGEPDRAFDDADRALLDELGLGRPRVLNLQGRQDAAARWYRGAAGPDTTTARAAAAACETCGYLVRLTGSLRQLFGVCANAWSPDDGRVVSLDHGCGAHSETGVEQAEPEPLPEPLLDQVREDLDVEPVPDEVSPEPEAAQSEVLGEAAEPELPGDAVEPEASGDVVEPEASGDVVEPPSDEPATPDESR